MHVFERLVGQDVIEVQATERELALRFSDRSWLTIWNAYDIGDGTAASLLGRVLLKFDSAGGQEVLSFAGGAVLTVDLRDEAWTGPEAMMLTRDGLPTVIWN